jgi:hypothetical protein
MFFLNNLIQHFSNHSLPGFQGPKGMTVAMTCSRLIMALNLHILEIIQ